MDHHGQAFARQQQRQQRGEDRQFASTVVAGQHHGSSPLHRYFVQPRTGGVQKAGHFLRRFALDAHRQAKRADLKIGDGTVEDLAEQVGSLLAREGPCAVLAAPDHLDVFSDACVHAGIVREAGDF